MADEMARDVKRRRVEGASEAECAVKSESSALAEGASIGGEAGASVAAAAGSDFAEQFMAKQMKRMAEKMAQMERELAAATTKKNTEGAGAGKMQPQNFELTSDGKRRVQVRLYRGQVQVDVREWYEKDGELRPGKRGLSLKVEQWKRLKAWIPKIEEAIESMS